MDFLLPGPPRGRWWWFTVVKFTTLVLQYVKAIVAFFVAVGVLSLIGLGLASIFGQPPSSSPVPPSMVVPTIVGLLGGLP